MGGYDQNDGNTMLNMNRFAGFKCKAGTVIYFKLDFIKERFEMKLENSEEYIEVRKINKRLQFRHYLWSFMRTSGKNDHTHDQKFRIIYATTEEAFPNEVGMYEHPSEVEEEVSLCTSDEER